MFPSSGGARILTGATVVPESPHAGKNPEGGALVPCLAVLASVSSVLLTGRGLQWLRVAISVMPFRRLSLVGAAPLVPAVP